MTLQEQLSAIVQKEQEREIIPFFKKLTDKDKKDLIPHIRTLSKQYSDYQMVGNTYKRKGTTLQIQLTGIAGFICLNRKDFEKYMSWYVLKRETLTSILDWYCPEWLSDYFNNFSNTEFALYHINYDWIMELSEKGYIYPSKELIVKVMPQMIYENRNSTWLFKPEHLLKRPITLQEHIWYIFEVESLINWSDRFLHFDQKDQKQNTGWIHALYTYSQEGKISRARLLKESILASTRNFNKTLSGWFVDLFSKLDPSKGELLKFQSEMFTALSSPHSKPINTVLQLCKALVEDKAFQTDDFLDNASVLLASETKSIVSSTLMILEKLAKIHKDKKLRVCELACHALIHQDDTIQTRTGKLILKYGDVSSDSLRSSIQQYQDTLLSRGRELLKDFVNAQNEEKSSISEPVSSPATPSPLLSEETELKQVENFDDLLYLTSQAFDNLETWHIDLLPAALLNMQHEIKGENILKLEPAIQRASKVLSNQLASTLGTLDHLFANFFITYTGYLIQEFPEETKSFQGKYTIYNFDGWHTYNNEIIYNPHKHVLAAALNKLYNKDGLPLLSTPTHTPAWIDPTILIQRLNQYLQKNVRPHEYDLQVAISRCAPERTNEAINAAENLLKGEYKNLFLYILGGHPKPTGPFTMENAWITAALARYPKEIPSELEHFTKFSYKYLTGRLPWRSFVEDYTYKEWDYKTRQQIKKKGKRETLTISYYQKEREVSNLKKVFTKLIPPAKKDSGLIYEYFDFKTNYFIGHHNDIQRLILLTPNNPEPMLTLVIHKALTYSKFWDEGSKKVVTKTIEVIHNIWTSLGETAHLFVATCMLSSEKTIRSFAAEVWIKGVTHGTINSNLLGDIIGNHESVEFAPLKRFTDLVMSNMFQISNQHNLELEKIIVALLKHLPETPVTNLKKLLDIYLETLSFNNSTITDPAIIEQLSKWKSSSTLNKTIAVLEKKNLK